MVALFLVGCGTSEPIEVTRVVEVPSEPETVEVTRLVEVAGDPETVEVTRIVEVERIVEVTRLVEVTAEPTPEPTTAPLTESGNIIANNYVAEFTTEDGFTIRIARFLVANKDEIDQDFTRDDSFDDADTVGEIVFEVINESDKTIIGYPDQGSIQINTELIELLDTFTASFGEDISGDILPGVRLVGGQWFPINRSTPAEITTVTFRMSGLRDENGRITEDIEITFDLEPIFEPLPEDMLD